MNQIQQLCEAGLSLVAIPPVNGMATKAPRATGWNKPKACDNPNGYSSQIDDFINTGGFNFGLYHGASNTIALDLDDLELAKHVFDELTDFQLIDWLNDDIRVEVKSPKLNRGKLLFSLPAGFAGAQMRQLKHGQKTIFELRCGNCQDVVIGRHPEGGDYQFIGDPAAIPEAPAVLLDMLANWEAWKPCLDSALGIEQVQPKIAQRKPQTGEQIPGKRDPIHEFNQANRVSDVLTRNGYKQVGNRFIRPGSESRAPGVVLMLNCVDNVERVYSHGGDDLNNGFAHDAFDCFVLLEHGSDFKAALAWNPEITKHNQRLFMREKSASNPVADSSNDTVDSRPAQIVTEKKIPATIGNIHDALYDSVRCNFWIGFDEFRDEVMFHRGDCQWQPFGDAQYTELRMFLPTIGFAEVGRELMRDAVLAVSEKCRFDSARLWLDKHCWDGVPRIERFFIDYFAAEDSCYTRSVGLYLWSAMAGRLIEPGCQADMVPILAGAQGIGKSTAVAALVPSPDFFCEISFTENEDNLARKMRGTLIAEIGELRGLHTRDLETIKAFVTRKHEKWTPKFKEFTTKFARRLVFVGTTNADQFLADSTGNRRWLPLTVHAADRDAIVRDRDQLWAEAAHVFKATGIAWQNAERLATSEFDKFEITEAWQDEIESWINTPDVVSGKIVHVRDAFTTNDCLVGCLGFDIKNIGRKEEMKAAKALAKLGFVKARPQINGKRQWVWVNGA